MTPILYAELLERYLLLNNNYLNSCLIGDKPSTINKLLVLEVMDWYLRIIEYYYYMSENDKSKSPITEENINEIVFKIYELEILFKPYYYDTTK